jgi:hypothetical protein
MNEVEQGALHLTKKPAQTEVALETILKRKDLLGAINLMFDLSGLDDKEIYITLGIDAGHFSNIRKGKAGCHFPPNKITTAMALCESLIPLQWLAHQFGRGLHVLESETERLLRIEREARYKAEEQNRLLIGLLQGKAG